MRKSKKLAIVLSVAAAMLLATGALAASGMAGLLTNWLHQSWEDQNEAPMEENQIELINHLTQPVGFSDTVDGVTITVDSVTVGDNTLWALLVVDGLEGPLAEPGEDWDHTYHTGMDRWWVAPLGAMEYFDLGAATYGINSAEITEDGRLCMVASFTTQMTGRASFLDGCHATYEIEEVGYGEETLAKGPWNLDFNTEPVDGLGYLMLDTAQFPAYKGGEERLVDVENVRISTSGISYMYKDDGKENTGFCMKQITLIFQDGTELVPAPGTMGYLKMGDSETVMDDYWVEDQEWPAPIDLTQVKSLRVGDMEFPLQ